MNISLKLLLSTLLCCCFSMSNAQNSLVNYALQPAPTWVKKYPTPKLNESDVYAADVPLLHLETQYNHDTGEEYSRFFYYMKDQNALNTLSTFYVDYEADFLTMHIHAVTIHRNNKKISYGDQLHVEYAEEGKQINGKHYDVDGKLIIFFDNKLQIGDIIEVAYSSTGYQPDLHGTLFFKEKLTGESLKGTTYVRVLSRKNKPFQYKLLNLSKKPTIQNRNGIMSLELIHDSKDNPKITAAPSWHQLHPKIYVTDLDSWSDFLNLYKRNYLLEKKPSPEVVQKVKAIVNKEDDKAEQINSILKFLQREIAYLEYDKIKPKQPALVLQQGFGDCKSKSLLAVKMLETIGVEAWPLIVHSSGYEERLVDFPGHAFNHCVMEFVHERDTLLFDATRDVQFGSIYDKYSSDFRYGFRLKDDTDKLHKITHNYLDETTIEVILHTRIDDGYYKNYKSSKVTYKGELSNRHLAVYNLYGMRNFTDNINDKVLTDQWIEDSLVSFTHDSIASTATITIKEDISHDNFREKDYETGTIDFAPKYLNNLLQFDETKTEAPKFILPAFTKTKQTYKIIHPEVYKVAEETIHYKKDWISFSKTLTQKKDTLVAVYTTEILKKELDSERFAEVRQGIDSIKALSVIQLDDAQSMVYQRRRTTMSVFFTYLFPVIGLLLLILVILFIIVFIKRGKRIKRQRTEIRSLKKELRSYKID